MASECDCACLCKSIHLHVGGVLQFLLDVVYVLGFHAAKLFAHHLKKNKNVSIPVQMCKFLRLKVLVEEN